MKVRGLNQEHLRAMLDALGEHLDHADDQVAVLIVGGAALSLRGLVVRTTDDVDVLAVLEDETLKPPRLTAGLRAMIARVGRDFGARPDWLNVAVGAAWRTGLPDGIDEGIEWLAFAGLDVGLASRRSLIALKLHAAVDHGRDSVHVQDLVALDPADAELSAAARWVDTQDALEEFPKMVAEVVDHVRNQRRDS